MPVKQGKKPQRGSNSTMPEFVSVNMSDEDWAAVKNTAFTEVDGFEFILETLGSGLKVSFAFDQANDCFICTVTQPPGQDGTTAKSLVSRGPEVVNAISVAAYKWRFKLDKMFDNAQVNSNRSVWG